MTSIHHPISVDRRIDLASSGKLAALNKRRWYGFVRMQARVARRLAGTGPLITVSESSRDDICRDFRIRPEHVRIIPLGVDTRIFRPRTQPRVPGRIVAVTSADSPIKGTGTLLRAVGKLVTDTDAHLVIVGQARARHRAAGRAVVPGGPGHVRPAACPTRRSRPCWPARRSPSCRRCTRVSRCPRWSIWPRAPRWWRAGPGRFPRSPATPPSWSRRAKTRNSRPCCAGCIDSPAERDALADRALRRVRERFAWSAVAEATAGQYLAAMEGLATAAERTGRVLTVDFRRFPVRPGHRVLDLGCGGGRHAFEVYRRGADVVAFDLDPAELASVTGMFGAMRTAGEATAEAGATAISGDATAMPFGDGMFDRVIAAEVLEHVLDDQRAMNELARVLRPGGLAAITVPSFLPERVCWALSTEYHEVPGGHVRIYTRVELQAKLARPG